MVGKAEAANRPELAGNVRKTEHQLVQANGVEAKQSSTDLAKAIDLNMADHWQANADNYFTRAPKKHLMTELGRSREPIRSQAA